MKGAETDKPGLPTAQKAEPGFLKQWYEISGLVLALPQWTYRANRMRTSADRYPIERKTDAVREFAKTAGE